MALRGTVHLGMVVFDQGAELPEGTRVEVMALRARRSRVNGSPARASVRRKTRKSTQVESVFDVQKLAVVTGIRDLAEQHDHYIYGTPKRRGSKKRSVRRDR